MPRGRVAMRRWTPVWEWIGDFLLSPGFAGLTYSAAGLTAFLALLRTYEASSSKAVHRVTRCKHRPTERCCARR